MHKTTQRALRLALSLGAVVSPAHAAPTGEVVGTVNLNKPGGAATDPSSVVVYLESAPGAPPPAAELLHPQVRQRDLQFTPPLTVLVKGTTVDFPNDDKVFHNVFSFSEAAKFDLGLYKSGTSKSVTFRQAGVVNLYCNIHPEMISKIKVLDTPYYSLVDKEGRFRIAHVPPGNYPLVAWQPYGAEYRGEVTVRSAGTVNVTLQLTVGEVDKRHVRKDGSPYGRYK